MKRSVRRDESLPAFKCDVPALGTAIASLLEQFSDGDPRLSIQVSLGHEELSFVSTDEILAVASSLPSTVYDVTILVFDSSNGRQRYASLTARYDDSLSISAKAESEAWCAGVTEVIRAFAVRHRRWYGALRSWVVWAAAIMMTIGPLFVPSVAKRPVSSLGWADVPWFVTLGALWALSFGYRRVFRPFTLVVRHDESWMRKYATEITVIAALISAAAAVIALTQR